MFWKCAANLQENTHAEVQLYWNRTSTEVFSCKFAAYFQNTFSKEHLSLAASKRCILDFYRILNIPLVNVKSYSSFIPLFSDQVIILNCDLRFKDGMIHFQFACTCHCRIGLFWEKLFILKCKKLHILT